VTDLAAPSDVPDPLEERLIAALPRLRAHLSRRARRVPGAEAEDVAQEVMARALRYRESFDPARAVWPWLRRTADRVLQDHQVREARRPAPAGAVETPAPEQALALDEREEVERVLAGLPAQEREVLLRFHQRGQPVRAIARDLGLPEGTVKSSLSRARRRLAAPADQETRP
jgi:RNA polymerase sigma-70 factor (ECF subfamily)